ncbi:MAG: citramalate synthase [Candidatus Marinimicrobia bacterium]|nr:citramalate synthase [Candidatus Neomarinimicrobiota bacterium]MCF7828674.1 citramalate synthase [Candidatus Neomarinimicrobiota bacterium]MCF7880415.1 citramalate synthase [Candidatus Neomarinimicrobiota bacterium]
MGVKHIDVFDTTLRDGTQGEKVAFSAEDKVRIAHRLDDFGIDYIEGGWPGSNPKDMEFFDRAKNETFSHAKIVAFGSTQRAGHGPEDDKNLKALIDAETPVVCIFGKSWILHVEQALKIKPEENLDLIRNSVEFLKQHDKEVIYDAEHFFDGYKANSEYAMKTLRAAESAGADIIVLCDTNGGTLPQEMTKIIKDVKRYTQTKLGIHAHNDSEVAVANSVAAVQAGCEHVQGTINGYGERCGNANLCSIIPNLQVKGDYQCVPDENIKELTSVSHFVSELANLTHQDNLPFVGKSAFAHKGGVHVSAVMKEERTYEHIEPESVGNQRRVLVSDLSGKSNVKYKANELDIDLSGNGKDVPKIVQKLKELENDGYQFEAAEASFELLVRKMTGEWEDAVELEGFRIMTEKNMNNATRSEATIRLNVNGKTEHTAAEGNGPVHALDRALRKALHEFYPEVDGMHLTDYKVRVLNEKDGTGAKVRVLIESSQNGNSWGTVGVSENIIEASWQALIDSLSYYLTKNKTQKQESSHETEEAAAQLLG